MDHPHIRGEYWVRQQNHYPAVGSSPHPWGVRGKVYDNWVAERIIPTSVGSTLIWAQDSLDETDHPHIRGEYTYDCEADGYVKGSSPHPWGVLSNCAVKRSFEGIIPTSVGSTFRSEGNYWLFEDHPHIRGEYINYK